MRRAYSLLTVKSIDEEQRSIEGIASTPTTDRMGDVVESMGAQFKLPFPLLWQHNHDEPVGHVEAAKVSKDGIAIKARLVKIAEPGKLKDRLDEAWQSIKYGLVRGLSIGFIPTADPVPIKGTYGVTYNAWDWMELSLVTIPANTDASILSIKSADQAQLAASGDRQRKVVRLASPPGASGNPSTIPKDPKMKHSLIEQIAALEAKRAASAARREEIQNKAIEAGRTKDEAEKQEFDTLSSEIKSIDDELVDLRLMESQAVNKATAITAAVGSDPATATVARGGALQHSGIISVGTKLGPAIPFARMAIALHRAHGDRSEALAIVQANKRWMDQSPEVAMVLKTAIPAADTLTSGWASELVYAQNMQNDFIEFVRPITILGRLEGVRRVPFNVRMGSLTGGTMGYWVGQGKAIPMSKGTTGSLSLGITKAAGLAAYDDEILRSSSPNIETMVRDDLARAVAQVIDVAFIDPNNGGIANEKPASILYNVTPTQASGTNAAAVSADVAGAFSAAIAATLDPMSGVWVMTPTTALRLSMMQTSLGQSQYPGITIKGGTWQGLPVIVSPNAAITGSPDYGNMIVLILQNEIILADDGDVDIQISNEASIEMLDNPTNLSTGATAPTTVVSMFQTQSWAIKAVRYVNWTKRRAAAAAFIRTAAYV